MTTELKLKVEVEGQASGRGRGRRYSDMECGPAPSGPLFKVDRRIGASSVRTPVRTSTSTSNLNSVRRLRRRDPAFTLIEMLAVIAIISLFIGILGLALRDKGSQSAGLQVAQSTLASTFTLVRSQAALDNENGALMVANDPTNPDRYLRFVVPAVWDLGTGGWKAITDGVYLPSGCYVIPRNGPTAGVIEEGANWSASPPVQSTALQQSGNVELGAFSSTAEPWIWTEVNARGTTGNAGSILVATARNNPPGAAAPFTYTNPDNVRGISISVYGQFTLLNERDDLTAP